MRHLNHLGHSRLPQLTVGVLLAWGLTVGTSAQAENLIVFKSQGIKMTPGQSINGDQPLQLTAGQKVELIASNGRIIKLAGPYDQAPAPGTPSKQETVVASLKALVVTGKNDTTNMGITRSATDVLKAGGKDWVPEPWLINVTQAGTHCQRAGQPLVFWRPERETESEIRLATENNTWKANTKWPAGSEKLAPPPTMPLKDGGVYQITLDQHKTDLTLKVIPEQVTQPPVLAAWMTESGCRAQSLALLRTIN
ncbi:MAG: hypothetical protein H7839_14100 [Magnetococcus sp. YQC-5]